jgi:hypothetical protein
MTDYHVTTVGNDANSGLSKALAFRTVKHAYTQASANDTILLYYDAASEHEFFEGALFTLTKNINFIGVDSADVRADDVVINGAATTWNKDEQPVILWTGSYTGRCFEPRTSANIVFRGITLDGSGTTRALISNSGETGIWQAYDCYFRGSDKSNIAESPTIALHRSGDEIHRCFVLGGRRNVNLENGASASFCIFSGSWTYGVNGVGGSDTFYMENCLVLYANEAKNSTIALQDIIYLGSSANIIRNTIAYNNNTTHGIDTADQAWDNVNSWTTDGALYHTTANYAGTKTAEHLELDPLFIDAVAGDFRLQDSSPMLGAGTTGLMDTLTYDLQDVAGSYPIGPYITAPAESPWSFEAGSGSVEQIQSNFVFRSVYSRTREYNRILDAIPFGLATPGPVSLRNRKTAYKVTK